MDRQEVREAVRDLIGDPTEGFWQNAELDRHIQIVCNIIARDGLAVAITENTTSLPGVQEYVLPPYFGEMRRVRWHSDFVTIGKRPLTHRPKTEILEYSDTLAVVDGEPCYYYNDSGRVGLYPIPNKKPLFKREPPDDECEVWKTVAATRDSEFDEVRAFYEEDISLNLEDACSIPCSHFSVRMRRNARPVSGTIALQIHPIGRPMYEFWTSRYINTRDLGTDPEWVHFDFTHHPIELDPVVTRYNVSFVSDVDFIKTQRSQYAAEGPQLAVEILEGAPFMYFQLHQFRQDIELDFYKNEVEAIETDYQALEIPNGYHDTIVKKAAARALRKGSRDVQSALIYESETEKEIKLSRAQAILRTRGRMQQPRRRRGRSAIATYDDGLWKGRAW